MNVEKNKLTKFIIKLFFLLFILLAGTAFSADPEKYLSPNGEYIANVLTIKNTHNGCRESEIIIKNKKGETEISYSYNSPFSSRYGLFVVNAAWTANSKFFVYSMSSDLTGYRSWHHPIFFISIDKKNVISLDDIYGPVVYPDFKLSPPDIIHAIVLSISIQDEYPFKESLSDLYQMHVDSFF